ncbi:hypothetical protein BZG02_18135 [Labilibaculum filiforme]|uniref:DUF304 domain-containing protein n=1 Tax=Labilibaculum filiforme TaxID=1940526 RepID=A0A2N3HRX5_9BACT|nr:hypothetical protein [Labilibaculum filiforme]PKQ60789.1 hypothetical protein BZG02_18135 [Labilibaculum filiforme]
MKIKYKKKRLKYYLYFGIAWLILGSIVVISDDELRWNDYGYLFLGVLHIGSFIYESRNQYLSIEGGFISKNSLFQKKMELSAIKSITSGSGKYILKTKGREMKIDVGLIDESSLCELNKVLANLNMESGKTIFV